MGDLRAELPPLIDYLSREPLFAVTSDLDWASEDCVGILLDTFRREEIVPTLFVTHDSVEARRAAAEGRAELGLHPNFLPGSSHGETPEQVVATVRAFAPAARGCRSHSFATSTPIARVLAMAGMEYESAPCLTPQPDLKPLRHWTGMMLFPIFWEDDTHWMTRPDWDFDTLESLFLSPGLKVLNVHPFFYALNIPDAEFYSLHKPLIQGLSREQAARLRHNGEGCAVFVQRIFGFLREHGLQSRTLAEIYDWARRDGW